ncbi:MAG TPA: hypothetical protein VKI19_07570 [Acidimicrobiales bacterium]|nr:hypothetical protein [Acidimicrobiales bacterium]
MTEVAGADTAAAADRAAATQADGAAAAPADTAPVPSRTGPGIHRRRRPAAAPDWRAWGRVARPWWRPVAVLVAARLAMAAAVFTFSHLYHHFTLNQWDGGWYLLAARNGWPHHVLRGFGGPAQDTLAFFPGFPTVIRAVHFVLPLSWTRAGEVAAFLTEVAMVIGVWLLARDVWGREVADRGVVALCFFPGSFILAMMYSEPLTIAAAAFCLLALRRRQWVAAGLLGTVGTATRVIGVALVAACAWEAYQAIRRDREWRSLSAVVLAPAGIVGWFVYLWASTGDRLAWVHTEKYGWAQHTTLSAIPDLVRSVLDTHPAPIQGVLAVAGTGLGLILLTVLVYSRSPGVLAVYSIAVLAISATSVNPSGIRFRFVLTAFPLVLMLGRYLRDAAFGTAVAASSVVMGVILVVTLMGPALIP